MPKKKSRKSKKRTSRVFKALEMVRNKTRKKSSVDIHSIRKIQDLVKYDIALYEHCNKHFNRRGGLKERYALSKFKILNKVYGLTR